MSYRWGLDAISVKDVSKRYGEVLALDNVSLNIGEGEIFGFLGPNGAGKTTLMEIIVGLREPDRGKVEILGIDMLKDKQKAKHFIGFNPQETTLYDGLTGLENISFIASLYSLDKETFKTRLKTLTDLLEMDGILKRRVEKLSGGQRRRISLAASLIHDPKIVVLDEPTIGLDPEARREFWGFIEKLKKEGKTIVLSTHYMEEADELCDRVAVMDLGKIVALDTPKKLKKIHGGTPKMIVKVKMRQVKTAEKVLMQYKPKISAVGLELRIDEPEKHVPDIVSKLENQGIDLESVEVRSPTLEDVFLNLTGKTLTEGD